MHTCQARLCGGAFAAGAGSRALSVEFRILAGDPPATTPWVCCFKRRSGRIDRLSAPCSQANAVHAPLYCLSVELYPRFSSGWRIERSSAPLGSNTCRPPAGSEGDFRAKWTDLHLEEELETRWLRPNHRGGPPGAASEVKGPALLQLAETPRMSLASASRGLRD